MVNFFEFSPDLLENRDSTILRLVIAIHVSTNWFVIAEQLCLLPANNSVHNSKTNQFVTAEHIRLQQQAAKLKNETSSRKSLI